MQPSNQNFPTVKGRGIGHRNLSAGQRVELAVGLITGGTHLTHLSRRQALDAVPGVTRRQVNQALQKLRNGNGAGKSNGS